MGTRLGGLLVCIAACGNNGGGGSVAVTARMLNGPVPLGTMVRPQATGGANLTDGMWMITPNQVRATLVAVGFHGQDDDHPELTNCTVTFDRSAPSLSTRLECPFTLSAGTYTYLFLEYSRTFEVLIDDATNGLYTDPAAPSLLSTTPPAGGAKFVPYTVSGGSGTTKSLNGLYFDAPLVVDPSSAPLALDIALEAVHAVRVQVTGSQPVFTSTDKEPLYLFPSLSGLAKAAYYSSSNTAFNFNPAAGGGEPSEVFLFYEGAQPAFVYINATGGIENCLTPGSPGNAQNISPSASPVGQDGNRGGGYLGKDPNGTICWALPTSDKWTDYASAWQLSEAAGPNIDTTLSCVLTTSVAAPTSGNTYASGCPMLGSTTQRTVRLVAQ